MSDLFHESVPEWFIEAVFDVMNQASQHNFSSPDKAAGSGKSDGWENLLVAEYLVWCKY